LAGNQAYKNQSTTKALIHHQQLDKNTQTLRRTSQAHLAYVQSSNEVQENLKSKSTHQLQGKQIEHEKVKSELNKGAATHEHYQASDFKRAAAAQLYSANDRAVNKALTIRDPAGSMAY
jgi:hypothetical protein